ncbi:unnamed protein product [Spirodela intermedia]|uniref:Uncharacterized protein n=1 Tax=Spirodela intermedia TaxID=51605 RepID=A0A7I8L5V5_SPIIN|nr:unnamed protein product [Spirodela intermedia]
MVSERLYLTLPNIPEKVRFNGINLHQWEQFVDLMLLGRGLTDHLIEESFKKSDPKYRRWKSEEAIIHTRLLSTMTLEMCENFLFMHSVKEL